MPENMATNSNGACCHLRKSEILPILNRYLLRKSSKHNNASTGQLQTDIKQNIKLSLTNQMTVCNNTISNTMNNIDPRVPNCVPTLELSFKFDYVQAQEDQTINQTYHSKAIIFKNVKKNFTQDHNQQISNQVLNVHTSYDF